MRWLLWFSGSSDGADIQEIICKRKVRVDVREAMGRRRRGMQKWHYYSVFAVQNATPDAVSNTHELGQVYIVVMVKAW